MDPFLYEYQKGVVGYGNAHGEVSVTNVTIEGIGAARFATVKSHFLNDVFSLKLNLYIPRIFCDGIVEVNGNIGEFGMVAKGTKVNPIKIKPDVIMDSRFVSCITFHSEKVLSV